VGDLQARQRGEAVAPAESARYRRGRQREHAHCELCARRIRLLNGPVEPKGGRPVSPGEDARRRADREARFVARLVLDRRQVIEAE